MKFFIYQNTATQPALQETQTTDFLNWLKQQIQEVPIIDGKPAPSFKTHGLQLVIVGKMKKNYRSNENLLSRSVLFIDIDFANDGVQRKDIEEALKKVITTEFATYPTQSNGIKGLRLRVVIPLNFDCLENNYQQAVRAITVYLQKTKFKGTETLLKKDWDHSNMTWSQGAGLPVIAPYFNEEDQKNPIHTFNENNGYMDHAHFDRFSLIGKTLLEKEQVAQTNYNDVDFYDDQPEKIAAISNQEKLDHTMILKIFQGWTKRHEKQLTEDSAATSSFNFFVNVLQRVYKMEVLYHQISHQEALWIMKKIALNNHDWALNNVKNYNNLIKNHKDPLTINDTPQRGIDYFRILPTEHSTADKELISQLAKDDHDRRYIPANDREYITTYGKKLGLDLSRVYDFKKIKNEVGEIIDAQLNGFASTETAQVAEIILALKKVFLDQGKKVFFDQDGASYVMSDNNAQLPTSFVGDKWKKAKDISVAAKITSFINTRLNPHFQLKDFQILIDEYFRNDNELFIDPFLKAVEITKNEILNGFKSKVELDDFVAKLSRGMNDEGAELVEPYRKKTLNLLYMGPVLIRYPRSATLCGPIQNMVIFVGPQGVGKTTLVNRLALGFSDTIKDPATTDQNNAIKRATNVFLENGELQKTRHTELEDFKAAITMESITLPLKFENIPTTFKCKAIMIGTSNHHDFLKDTEERRFLPITLNKENFNVNDFTVDYMLRCYGTAMLKIDEIIDNSKYDEINQTLIDYEQQLANLKKQYNENPSEEIKNNVIQIAQQANQARENVKNIHDDLMVKLSLNVPETAVDLEYKKLNFTQFDSELQTVKEFFADICNTRVRNTGDITKDALIDIDQKNERLIFTNASKLKQLFNAWSERESNEHKKVWADKIDNFLDITKAERTRMRTKIGNVHVIVISMLEMTRQIHDLLDHADVVFDIDEFQNQIQDENNTIFKTSANVTRSGTNKKVSLQKTSLLVPNDDDWESYMMDPDDPRNPF